MGYRRISLRGLGTINLDPKCAGDPTYAKCAKDCMEIVPVGDFWGASDEAVNMCLHQCTCQTVQSQPPQPQPPVNVVVPWWCWDTPGFKNCTAACDNGSRNPDGSMNQEANARCTRECIVGICPSSPPPQPQPPQPQPPEPGPPQPSPPQPHPPTVTDEPPVAVAPSKRKHKQSGISPVVWALAGLAVVGGIVYFRKR